MFVHRLGISVVIRHRYSYLLLVLILLIEQALLGLLYPLFRFFDDLHLFSYQFCFIFSFMRLKLFDFFLSCPYLFLKLHFPRGMVLPHL